MKILLAIDSSALSEAVVNEVETRPWPPATEIRVLMVIDLLALTAAVGYLEPFIKSEHDAAKAFVQSIAERLGKRGLNSTGVAVEGYPGTTIVEEAERWGADFVFVGSHGHSGFVSFLIGSIAKSVVQNTPCSVEIVRHPRHDKDHPEHAAADEPGRAMRILLATDGSEHSAAAVRSIASRPWPNGSQVRIISVFHPSVHLAGPWPAAGAVVERVRQDSRKICEEAVKTAHDLLSGTQMRTTTAVLEGSPKKRIVEDANEWGAHLVVVGSHGNRGVTRFLLGSVSEAVAMHAQCSVEVIRDRTLLTQSA